MIFNNLFKRLFNRVTLTKVIIIFIVGLFSRVFINYFYGVNVFVEYTNLISLYYYGFMSLFAVFINEIVVFFEFDVVGVFIDFVKLLVSLLAYFIKLLFNIFSSKNGNYFTLEGYSDNSSVKKPFSSVKSIFTLQKGRSGGDSRWLSRGKPSSAGVSGLYPHSDIRRPHSAAVEGLYGEQSRSRHSGNVDTSEFNRGRRCGGRHHSHKNPVDISTSEGLYSYPRDGYSYPRDGYGGYGSYANQRQEAYGYPRAQNYGVYELPNNDIGVRHELANNQVGGSYTVGYFQLSNVRRHELDGHPVSHSYGRHELHHNDVSRDVTDNSRVLRESRVSDESSTLLGVIPEGQVERETNRTIYTRGYLSGYLEGIGDGRRYRTGSGDSNRSRSNWFRWP